MWKALLFSVLVFAFSVHVSAQFNSGSTGADGALDLTSSCPGLLSGTVCRIQTGMKVIIIDSIPAEWEGSSGVIETHGNMAGNSFTNWNKITPRHNAFVQKMLQSPCHLIATIRWKQDYVLTDKNGRLVPEKVGLKGITRDGMDYEFTVVFDLDIKHQATASKDRTGLFMDKPQFIITEATGALISDWCKSGFKVGDIELEITECTDHRWSEAPIPKVP